LPVRVTASSRGSWDRWEDWLSKEIAEVWRLRGPYPGIGAALETIDLRLGTALVLELHARKCAEPGSASPSEA
jgi:hypothetical protein